jgi:hypothetical protein
VLVVCVEARWQAGTSTVGYGIRLPIGASAEDMLSSAKGMLGGGGVTVGLSSKVPSQQGGPSLGGCVFGGGYGGCYQSYQGNMLNATVGAGIGEGVIVNTNMGWHEASYHDPNLPY